MKNHTDKDQRTMSTQTKRNRKPERGPVGAFLCQPDHPTLGQRSPQAIMLLTGHSYFLVARE